MCRGDSATFSCVIINDNGFLQTNQWRFANNNTDIRSDTPNHMLVHNVMGQITNLIVNDVTEDTSYICTTALAPSDFSSTVSLTVEGTGNRYNITKL